MSDICGNNHRTSAEKKLAVGLRQNKIFFHHNVYLCGFEIDFWFPQSKLVVEVDGYSHLSHTQRIQDQAKDRILIESGVTIYRLSNSDIRENLPDCIAKIQTQLASYQRVKETTKSINDDWKKKLKQVSPKNEPPQVSKKVTSIETYFLSLEEES